MRTRSRSSRWAIGPDEHDLVAVAVGVDDREARLVARPAAPPDEDLVLERRAGDALDHPVVPTAAPQPGARAIGPVDGGADRLLGADQDQPLLRAGDRGVEQLAGEDRRGRGRGAARRRCRTASPGSCGRSWRRRSRRPRAGDGLKRDDLALALERGGGRAVGGGDHDAGVAVVEAEPVVVLGHEQRAADVPRLGVEAGQLAGEPASRCAASRSRRRGGRGGGRTARGRRRARGSRRRRVAGAGGFDDGDGRCATAPSRTGASEVERGGIAGVGVDPGDALGAA